MREGAGVDVIYLMRQYKTGNAIQAQHENSTPIVNSENKDIVLMKPGRDFTSLILPDFNLSEEKINREIF